MTIIVTGGAGFIGGNFIHYYLKEHPKDRVICIDKLTYAGNLSTLASVMDKPNFRFCKLDICDREGVFALFEEEKPDVVINFAAESHVDRSIENPGIFLQTNIIGTATMMDACRAFGNVRYHQVSTDEVYGNGFRTMLKAAVKDAEENGRATVFGYYVPDPERFGVVEFDEKGRALSIEEKPKQPKSNYAVTGLYFYPAGVSERANQVKPSARGELEITTLNEMYLNDGLLDVQLLGRGFAWLDTGTMQSLLQAAEFVEMIQSRQGITISAPEEIAFINRFIDKDKLMESAKAYGKSPYGEHLKAVAEGKVRY